MIKIKYLFILTVVLSFILSCKGKRIQNQWADHEITIDGKYADWEGISQNFLEDQNLVMGLTNDENNLYLMFRGNDDRMARRIRMMGVTVWLNKESKKKDYGICYTGSTDLHVKYRPENSSSDMRSKQMQERIQKMREKLREKLPESGMIMIIRDDEREEVVENNPRGPCEGSAYQNGVFCYEFKMPIPISTDLGEEIRLGLELGGMSEKDRNAMRQEMGSMRGAGKSGRGMIGGSGGRRGAMGGRPGGMRGGGRPFGGSGFEKQEMWFTVVLATENNND